MVRATFADAAETDDHRAVAIHGTSDGEGAAQCAKIDHPGGASPAESMSLTVGQIAATHHDRAVGAHSVR